jgi:uncharacterized protein (DUF697 family)
MNTATREEIKRLRRVGGAYVVGIVLQIALLVASIIGATLTGNWSYAIANLFAALLIAYSSFNAICYIKQADELEDFVMNLYKEPWIVETPADEWIRN